MGGNIFQNLRRIPKDEFQKLFYEVHFKLQCSIFTQLSRVEVTRSYFTKETFGDMDLIVESDHLKHDWREYLAKKFNLTPDELAKGGNVTSFRYKDFQIDLILTPNKQFQMARNYFSWNDLSNLMGRVTHAHGLKFAHNGLYMTVRTADHIIGNIELPYNMRDFCEYFGWDYDEWETGFQTMEDAYKWVVKSKYFNRDIFSLENRNHSSRVRDKKRANYTGFLTWLEQHPEIPSYTYETIDARGGYQIVEPFFSMICERWPTVREQFDVIMAKHNREQLFKSRWSGGKVGEELGLVGVDLGNFMKYAREQFHKTPTLVDFVCSEGWTDTHFKRFANSLKWHYDNNFEYGKIPPPPLKEKCEHCEIEKATMYYFSQNVCAVCRDKLVAENNHADIFKIS